MRAKNLTSLAFIAVTTLVLGACQAIAGIEDRKLDPSASDTSVACESYCDTVFDLCRGENAVYTTREQCLGVCALLDEGDELEPVGNTLACRMQEAKSAEREPEEHCKFLGPGGGGKCGSDCDAYCQLFPLVCPDDVKYTTTASCLRACGGLTDQDRFDVEADHDGDTIECRLVHLSSATVKPAEHCAHAPIPPSEPWCTGKATAAPTCGEYCQIQLAACDGALQQYEDQEQCEKTCEALDAGTNADEMENTVGCRRYHSFSATLAAEQHCSHSGPTGDGHCGSTGQPADGESGNCDSYCQLLSKACPLELTALGGLASCKAECLELDEAKPDSKYSVVNAEKSTALSCRVLNTTRAFADPTFCAAAIGGPPCAP